MQMRQISTNHVLQFDTFQIAPDPFVRVQLWCVSGESLQMNTGRRPASKEILDLSPAMNGSSVPNDQQLAWNMPQKVLQEADDVDALKGAVLHQHVELSLWRDPADGRKVVSCQTRADDRRLPHWSVGSHDRWQQVETRFVHPKQCEIFLYGLFFTSGQRSCRHRSMASSSRWLARRTGFCTLQPQSRRIRLTWAGWYETPNSRRITSATREQVHMSPRKPKVSTPLFNSSGIRARCSGVKRGVGPGTLRVRNASIPPSRPRFSHWLIAPCVTPNASAIRHCFQPFWCSSQARKRRASRQSVGRLDRDFSIAPSIPQVYNSMQGSVKPWSSSLWSLEKEPQPAFSHRREPDAASLELKPAAADAGARQRR